MLRVSVHAGLLRERCPQNQIAALDIAYHKRAAMADYLASLQLAGKGELQPAILAGYPRWAGSVWDLVARAITAVLYRSAEAPPVPRVDKRCAYATKMCAVVQRITLDDRGAQLGTVEILQPGHVRGEYRATFTEDIFGPRTATFSYGTKQLNPADLLLRAICHSLWGIDVLGPRPALILPATMRIDGEDRFDLQSLAEPARTGFSRYQANRIPLAKPEPMPKAQDYVAFLTRA
jgi:hypothetical protein